MSYAKLSDIIRAAEEQAISFPDVILLDDIKSRNISAEESRSEMKKIYDAIVSADRNYDGKLKSKSGLAGGDGALIENYVSKAGGLISPFMANVMVRAVKMAESNACMQRIVAMPTAGSCGVIPAVLLSYEKERRVSSDRIIEALYVAGGIGEAIAESASISGAAGGCQSEIGSAAAMAAGALTYLEGGSNEAIIHAAALTMKNMLGLTCDPVAGLVEIPCIKRNVSGAVNAVMYSLMALAGVRSAISPDEVIDSMRRIGKLIPTCLRETGEAGLATTGSAMKVAERLKVIG